MKLSDIHSNKDNPRVIKDDKFKKLVSSIKDFPKMMELRPIIVDDTMTILGGNMRYKALQEAGFTEIPDEWVKQAKDLTEEEKKQFIVKDNLPFGEWDWDILANNFEIKDLVEWGFDEKDLKIEQEVEEDEVPEVSDEPAISKLGEVYQLGRHRLMCGDSTKIEDVEKLMNGQKADMVLTDPPYGIGRDRGFGGFGGFRKPIARKQYSGDWDNNIPPKECFDSILSIADKVLIFGGNFFAHLLPQGKHWIVWDKKNTMPTFGDAELIWTNIDRDSVKIKSFEYNGLIGKEKEQREHATQKPLALIVEIVKEYSEDNNTIADLFGGSGSTLIACEQTNRTCYMMELDPKYCDVIRKRYAKFIGKETEWETITRKI